MAQLRKSTRIFAFRFARKSRPRRTEGNAAINKSHAPHSNAPNARTAPPLYLLLVKEVISASGRFISQSGWSIPDCHLFSSTYNINTKYDGHKHANRPGGPDGWRHIGFGRGFGHHLSQNLRPPRRGHEGCPRIVRGLRLGRRLLQLQRQHAVDRLCNQPQAMR